MDDPRSAFLEAASAPLTEWHGSGTLELAESIRAANPSLMGNDLIVAAVLGDAVTVRRMLAADRSLATRPDGPRSWAPLTWLCFSRYLRLDRVRSQGFVEAARALLDAGADPNGGWFEPAHEPEPIWESVLYGAAGVAHHPELTRLLLERGADPNDGETPYHAPETRDNATLRILVESGKLTADNLAMMLIRKVDWHDGEGVRWLLEAGADPNWRFRGGKTALHNAVRSDNDRDLVALLLDHGADPSLPLEGRSAVAMAARRGRADLLALFESRGIPTALEGVDRLIAACARDDEATIRTIAGADPGVVKQLLGEGGTLLAEFSGTGNSRGVGRLLDLGVPIDARYGGDGYFGTPAGSTALHVAAWRAWHGTVRLLLDRGAPVDPVDGNGRTPLMLAIRATVDSYWTHRRSTESIAALLRAGANTTGIALPTGYQDADALLREHGAA